MSEILEIIGFVAIIWLGVILIVGLYLWVKDFIIEHLTKKDNHPINQIKVGDEQVMTIDVGSGWEVTGIWFDHDVPVELVDCIKVKFERSK